MPTYLEQAIAQTTAFETAVPWMYRDTRGFVTAGIGYMLPDVASAQALAFVDRQGQIAPPAAIHADFTRVQTLAPGLSCQAYRSTDSLTLPEHAMTALLSNMIAANDLILRARLADYDGFPTPAKLALLDMLYNLGETKLFREYPLLLAAVNHQHWLTVSQQCHRAGPNSERNQWTRNQFLASAR